MVDFDTANASWLQGARVPVSFLRYILTFFGGMPDAYRADALSRPTQPSDGRSASGLRLWTTWGNTVQYIDFFFFKSLTRNTRSRRPVLHPM